MYRGPHVGTIWADINAVENKDLLITPDNNDHDNDTHDNSDDDSTTTPQALTELTDEPTIKPSTRLKGYESQHNSSNRQSQHYTRNQNNQQGQLTR